MKAPKLKDAFDKDGRPIPVFVPPARPPAPTLPPFPGQKRLADWMADVDRKLEQLNARVLALEQRGANVR